MHRCTNLCCPVRKGMPDREGVHMCVEVCAKPLRCGKHTCSRFCHIGACQPCDVFSNAPIYCECGAQRRDPPVRCGSGPPPCYNDCKKEKPCGHPCHANCHPGPCPPCLANVARPCMCGKEQLQDVACSALVANCGRKCAMMMACGHACEKECH